MILERIKTELNHTYGIDNATIESDLNQDLGMDSLDRIELFLWADKEYSIYINDFDAEDINTIGDLIKTIEEKFKCTCFTNAQKKACKKCL